jgi:hypothetical protein
MMDARTKTVRSHRKRLRRRGLQRVEVLAPAREAPVIRQVAAMLHNPAEAMELRRHLASRRQPAPRARRSIFSLRHARAVVGAGRDPLGRSNDAGCA